MPMLPPRICASCGRRKPAGAVCECAKQIRKAQRDKARPSARQRGYGTKLEQASKAFLREHPRCAHCGRESATHVDHVIPHGGDMRLFWNRRNWQPLCASCHSRKTVRQDGGFGHPTREAMSRKRLPPPPEALPPEMHKEWRAVVADLRDRGALDPITLGMACSYVMARWTAREAEKVIAREGVFAVGKNGIGKPHPATGLLRSSRDTLARLGFQLGLTPAARARHAAAQPAAKPGADTWDL